MAIVVEQDPGVADLARRTRAFVREVVVPVEEEHRGVVHDEGVRAGLQAGGSLGVSGDVLPGRVRREVRPFRIDDGASEAHRWATDRRVVRRHSAGVPA